MSKAHMAPGQTGNRVCSGFFSVPLREEWAGSVPRKKSWGGVVYKKSATGPEVSKMGYER